MIAAFVGTTVIAVVALINVGARWWLVAGFVLTVALIVGIGFWPQIREWWGKRHPKPITAPDAELITVESEYFEVVCDGLAVGARSFGQDVCLAVLNEGERQSFSAQVEDVQGARAAPPRPYSIPWRDSGREDQVLASGATKLLHLGVADPMGTFGESRGGLPNRFYAARLDGPFELFPAGIEGMDDLYTHRYTFRIRVRAQDGRECAMRLRLGFQDDDDVEGGIGPRLELDAGDGG